jgi:hypothetical protein
VLDVVGQMGEQGAAGADPLRRDDRLGDREVGRVGTEAQRAEHQHLDAGEPREALLGDEAHVGDVGEGTDPVAEDL